MRKEERGGKSQEAGRPQESVALERRHGQPAARWEATASALDKPAETEVPRTAPKLLTKPFSPPALSHANPHTHKGMSVFPCWEDSAPTGTGMRMNQISVFSEPKTGSANTVWHVPSKAGDKGTGPRRPPQNLWSYYQPPYLEGAPLLVSSGR